jgi:dienelactone hydrolase
MNRNSTVFSLLFSASLFFFSCSDASNTSTTKEAKADTPNIKEVAVAYTANGTTFNGFVTYNEAMEGKRPVVLVVPEWWGLNEYPRMRAKMLAEMGYIAMAIDMYGGGKIAADPKEAQTLATPFYQNPQLTKERLDAALNKIKEYPQADMDNAAAIGYCFGGYSVLNAAKLGANVKGVVSFHGNLSGAPAQKELLKASVLVCHGGADQFVPEPEVAAFKKSMDSIGANYTFKVYPGATHAFTNPNATATGKKFNMPIEYNAAADTASWNDMKAFFQTIFNK